MRDEITYHSGDLIVVGTGVAGLMVALRAIGREVLMLSKSTVKQGSSSVLAQGGIAAALGDGDTPAKHAADTVSAAAGLADPEIVELVTCEGPQRMREIIELGMQVDRRRNGDIALGREAAHSERRIVHASGDATGAELIRTLGVAAAHESRITVEENILVLDLLVHQGRVVGVTAVDREGGRHAFLAADVVIATGGAGQLWSSTTNPREATADGVAMAARAGAILSGLEFMQFHPTALAGQSNPRPLLTEALRGEGATLIDEHGFRFMVSVHPLAELAPRDVVARGIWRHANAGHEVFLGLRDLGERIESRFPTVFGICTDQGFDPTREPLPVSPAAHYHMGGIEVDEQGRSSLRGLSACGEATHSGLHGANRLASNSLLEGLVFGARIGERLRTRRIAAIDRLAVPRWRWPQGTGRIEDSPQAQAAADRIRAVMWDKVGLERSEWRLADAEDELRDIDAGGAGELENMLTAARLVTRAARIRTESRGAHFRSDFPMTDHHWQQDLFFEGMTPLGPQPVADTSAVAG